jgi:N4-gp56 family major capsid protein
MPTTTYGDISPRTAAYASKVMLKRGIPIMVFERFGQSKPVPRNMTKSIKFRRYEALDPSPKVLAEGVTPASTQLTKTDIEATLSQYGDWVEITDVIQDTHEDPVLNETVDILGEQAAEMMEIVRYGVLKAGTNVVYANGTSRAEVNTPVSLGKQRAITRSLKRQRARVITRVLKSTPDYGTEAVAPAFIGIAHTDVESDIREMPGFVPVEKYGSMSPYEGEIGKVEDVRYICTSLVEPWADAGGAATGMVSTGGTQADVYPVLYIARDAYGIVPLKGKGAITPMVLNPNVPRGGDPLGQRGSAGWKNYHTAVILNDLWMARLECGVSEL